MSGGRNSTKNTFMKQKIFIKIKNKTKIFFNKILPTALVNLHL